ncbi:MAG: D-hexose-6-phosphate mutarotase [Alteromonadaceae bacterium]|nr:D-hexose-6-phosphate mutarotase [Alteromonadaceae bacterium]
MTIKIIGSNDFGQVELVSLKENETLVIKHHSCSAKFSLYGGHVLAWQPKDEKPVFWLSDKATYRTGTAIRGGIPLCWPWFGPFVKGEQSAGNHGFARLQNWQIDEVIIEPDSVKLIIRWQGENMHSLWPAACSLRQEIVFGEKFSQTLFMTNLSEEDVEYTGALHSYFSVSDPKNVTIDNLIPAEFIDKVSGSHQLPQTLANCVGEIDRIYHCNKTMQIVDKKWQRIIEVSSTGCQQWVLWNPGKALADKMSDIHVNGEKEFVCLEAANTQWQTIPARSTVTIGQKIQILAG